MSYVFSRETATDTNGPTTNETDKSMVDEYFAAKSKGDGPHATALLQKYFETTIMRNYVSKQQLTTLKCDLLTNADCVEVLRRLATGGNCMKDPQQFFDMYLTPMLAKYGTYATFARDPVNRVVLRDCCGSGIAFAFVAMNRSRANVQAAERARAVGAASEPGISLASPD